MKVLLINGSANAYGCTYTALSEVVKELEVQKIGYEIFQTGKMPINGCIACFECQKNHVGRCVFTNDIVNEVISKIREADALVVGSPVYYAGMSGRLKSLLDRAFFAGGEFSNKLGAAVVSCRRGGGSAAFDQINHYFTIRNMHIVASQYWNQVHGYTPEDVRKDLEGMQTMRTLGKNMAWLLKCIEAGRNARIEDPVHEPIQVTDFIR